MHLVHIRSRWTLERAVEVEDGLAVVAVFFEIGEDAAPLQEIVEGIRKLIKAPSKNYLFIGDLVLITNLSTFSILAEKIPLAKFDPLKLLPEERQMFYRYKGSLTTPPCAETVIWTVLAGTVSVTESQVSDSYHAWSQWSI